MPPVIALLTDFGLQDPYVGAMKGAILSVCPEATLVDVLHDVPAHDVAAGALALDSAYRHFPRGTVFVAVVDPGVGSPRRPVAVTLGAQALPLVRSYSDVEQGAACALFGSSGRLEIAVHRGRADALPGAGRGARVRVRRRSSGVLHSPSR
jgi:S-adenosylmethionine hydrolase